jgi:hypothetical protein
MRRTLERWRGSSWPKQADGWPRLSPRRCDELDSEMRALWNRRWYQIGLGTLFVIVTGFAVRDEPVREPCLPFALDLAFVCNGSCEDPIQELSNLSASDLVDRHVTVPLIPFPQRRLIFRSGTSRRICGTQVVYRRARVRPPTMQRQLPAGSLNHGFCAFGTMTSEPTPNHHWQVSVSPNLKNPLPK